MNTTYVVVWPATAPDKSQEDDRSYSYSVTNNNKIAVWKTIGLYIDGAEIPLFTTQIAVRKTIIVCMLRRGGSNILI